MRAVYRGGDPEHREAARLVRQPPAAPDVAVDVGVDDALQRPAELAHRLHALLDVAAAENLLPKLQSALVKLPGIHIRVSRSCFERSHCTAAQLPKARSVRLHCRERSRKRHAEGHFRDCSRRRRSDGIRAGLSQPSGEARRALSPPTPPPSPSPPLQPPPPPTP